MNTSACPAHDPSVFDAAVRAGLNLLLVCRDPDWARAVHDAMESRNIDVCDARGALARLAGVMPTYSHLLLQPHCDDGLFDALFQMTSEAAGSDTELLMLGGIPTRRADLNVIHSATPRLVQEALMVGPRSRRPQDAPFSLAEIRAALDGGMISARYQPIVRLSDRRPVALEVLARLDHPAQGTVLPDRFIPQIEDAGLAARLTELITARAFSALGDFLRQGLSLAITLNFPLDVIMRPEAIQTLEEPRQAAGIPAGLVSIELTESMPVQDFPALRQVLERIRGLGYRAAIDDVSPSVPGLTELLALPFTGLKLDKNIIVQALADAAILDFVRTTTDRAHQAGMIVVAEGIETPEAWHLVRSAGVDGAQGYLLARPLPAAAVPVWIDNWQRNPAVD
ncbi:MAG: EAL domain-containing protein [Acetobacteraceae bacterium]